MPRRYPGGYRRWQAASVRGRSLVSHVGGPGPCGRYGRIVAVIRVGFTRSIKDDYEAIVLLDVESGDTIEFQRSLTHDPQDVRFGMDTYAIVRGGAAVHYGGLVRFDVRGYVLALELDPEAAEVLELPDLLELTVDGAAAEIIEQHLPRILAPPR